ncbi:hypothetical protein L596_021176 [Steinernema carpocapsae]|uniref:Uncharacterized protein n=1 Tax=Steinernema carpocapsae TaxID=34508 RepID=A0A4U5MWX0_STECR|nr:hypothetical protein L596_021176 [Steinernema carpocapsae]
MRAVSCFAFALAAFLGTVVVGAEQELVGVAMKRSLALGRMGFRPGKRSMEELLDEEVEKRSLALGRMGFRPGKRSVVYDFVDPNELDGILDIITEDQMGKRSIALGRAGFRPAKRSLALGRTGFRPGKRSIALGRERFRPGKRSVNNMTPTTTVTPPFNVASGRCQLEKLQEVYQVLLKLAQGYEEMTKNCTAENPFQMPQ